MNFKKLIKSVYKWQFLTFPKATSLSKLHHLTQEIEELKSAIFHEHSQEEKKMEYADCFHAIIWCSIIRWV